MPGPSPVPPAKTRARIRFPAELPISERVADITRALSAHQVVIVVGSTGSGKTTQLPKVALEMGRGGRRQIGVTQPRRIAATSVAARVAKELECELGNEVGYQIRFEDRTCPNTWVKFMTDGILLAEVQGDRLLQGYDTLIIDEAHERSLNIDFLLGWLKRILPQRPDLKVIVSSATIASEQFSAFFGDAPVIQVEGRTFPVEVLYEPPASDLELSEAVADAVVNVTSLDPRGDILIFLPGEREIREAEQALLAKNLRHTELLPLYARLSSADQAKAFTSTSKRRVILATNVAETSLTIPGIVYVIDTGIARLSRYDPRTGTTRLQIEAVSQASADQRKGRCGRVREGICVRLYDADSFAARPAFTDPEMKRTGLAGVILRMKSLDLGDIEDFPFLDPPHSRSIAEGYRVLEELGALTTERELTPLGKRLADFPVDPRIARMVFAGEEFGCLEDVLTVASALSTQDPRERPRGQEQKVDQLHQRFRDEQSDFVGLLRLWEFIGEQENKSRSQLRKACKDNFLSYTRVREWSEVRRQLADLVRESTKDPRRTRKTSSAAAASASRPDCSAGVPADNGRPPGQRSAQTKGPKARGQAVTPGAARGDALHLALLTGLLSRIGQWNAEQRSYVGARQTRFALHPSSGLAKKPPAWVMAFELVETRQLFARMAARIDPLWLDSIGQHLIRRSYSEPHWSEQSARASVKEHATLFGLPVSKDRSVDYATLAPARARMMFIEHALVRGEYVSRGQFQQKNRELLEEVARLRDKARLSDMLVDDEHLHEFFDRRVPASVVNGKTFESWRETAERANPELLHLSLADVLSAEGDLSPEAYPDIVTIHGVAIAARYCFDPAAEDDGITLEVPLTLLPQLAHGELDWTIPAWHQRKIAALLEELPRQFRRDLGNRSELAAEIAAALTPSTGPLLPALAQAILRSTGIDVPLEAFRLESLPRYLRFNVRVLDERGKVVEESRDLAQLLRRYVGRARESLREALGGAAAKSPSATSWQFGEIPSFVTRRIQGTELRCYPALADRKTAVELGMFETAEAAASEHRAGLRRLVAILLRPAIANLVQRAPAPFSRRFGMPAPKAERSAFAELLIERVLDEAFQLNAGELPRSKVAFEQWLTRGTPRLAPGFDAAIRALTATRVEYDKLSRAIDSASKHPAGSAALAEIREQLDQLLPPDFLARVPLRRLDQLPRYLRAAEIRLARAVVDPRKDAAKAAPFTPVWRAFLAKSATARDREAVERLRWLFEELRVALFAPELRPAEPVTIANVSAAVGALR